MSSAMLQKEAGIAQFPVQHDVVSVLDPVGLLAYRDESPAVARDIGPPVEQIIHHPTTHRPILEYLLD